MSETHYRSCCLCEATCGVVIETEGDQVISVRGDDADPFSQGYICPKAAGLADLHHDPDRLHRPMVRDGASWRETGWDEAFDLVAERLRAIQNAHGKDAIAVYQGNPTAHNFGLMALGQPFFRGLKTKNVYSATSVDQLPHMLAALQMFGNHFLMAVPDIDRTDYMLILGANRRERRRGAPDRDRARVDATRAVLRPDRRVHAGVRRARDLAVLRDQRPDPPPRRGGRDDVHDAGGGSVAAVGARRLRRIVRQVQEPGVGVSRVRRRAAGRGARRGDRDAGAGPGPRADHERRQSGAVDDERRPAT